MNDIVTPTGVTGCAFLEEDGVTAADGIWIDVAEPLAVFVAVNVWVAVCVSVCVCVRVGDTGLCVVVIEIDILDDNELDNDALTLEDRVADSVLENDLLDEAVCDIVLLCDTESDGERLSDFVWDMLGDSLRVTLMVLLKDFEAERLRDEVRVSDDVWLDVAVKDFVWDNDPVLLTDVEGDTVIVLLIDTDTVCVLASERDSVVLAVVLAVWVIDALNDLLDEGVIDVDDVWLRVAL